jgi:hypothetical protein
MPSALVRADEEIDSCVYSPEIGDDGRASKARAPAHPVMTTDETPARDR